MSRRIQRGPAEQLRYQFETVARLPEREQEVVRDLLDAVIVKNQVAGALQRVASRAAAKAWARAKRAAPAAR